MTDEERLEAAGERYRRAAHAMQSGVAFGNVPGDGDQSPKHLRVGINSAMVETGALADLLIAKGVFSNVEWAEALAAGMEAEKARYEHELEQQYGRPVSLG